MEPTGRPPRCERSRRDRLQRHLLQQAETSIVALANEVLDRLSGGTLWLELKREAEGEVSIDYPPGGLVCRIGFLRKPPRPGDFAEYA